MSNPNSEPFAVRRVSSATAALQQRRASLATSVAFHSLLYHLCSFYESNHARRESLFEVSHGQYEEIGFLFCTAVLNPSTPVLFHPGTMLENVEDRPRARPPPTEGALVAAVSLPARFRQAHQDSAGVRKSAFHSRLFK